MLYFVYKVCMYILCKYEIFYDDYETLYLLKSGYMIWTRQGQMPVSYTYIPVSVSCSPVSISYILEPEILGNRNINFN